jgi:hypothetical protein
MPCARWPISFWTVGTERQRILSSGFSCLTRSRWGYQGKDYITVGYPALYSMRRKESGRPAGKLLSRVREA